MIQSMNDISVESAAFWASVEPSKTYLFQLPLLGPRSSLYQKLVNVGMIILVAYLIKMLANALAKKEKKRLENNFPQL